MPAELPGVWPFRGDKVSRNALIQCTRLEVEAIRNGDGGGGGGGPEGPIDITDAIFTNTDADCAAYANTYAATVADISRSLLV